MSASVSEAAAVPGGSFLGVASDVVDSFEFSEESLGSSVDVESEEIPADLNVANHSFMHNLDNPIETY